MSYRLQTRSSPRNPVAVCLIELNMADKKLKEHVRNAQVDYRRLLRFWRAEMQQSQTLARQMRAWHDFLKRFLPLPILKRREIQKDRYRNIIWFYATINIGLPFFLLKSFSFYRGRKITKHCPFLPCKKGWRKCQAWMSVNWCLRSSVLEQEEVQHHSLLFLYVAHSKNQIVGRRN